MLAIDKENLIIQAYQYLKNATQANTLAVCCDGEPFCCVQLSKVWYLMTLIDRATGILDEEDINNLYGRLQCLIGLKAV